MDCKTTRIAISLELEYLSRSLPVTPAVKSRISILACCGRHGKLNRNTLEIESTWTLRGVNAPIGVRIIWTHDYHPHGSFQKLPTSIER